MLNKKNVLIFGNHEIVIYNFRRELIQTLLQNGYKIYLSLPYGEKAEKLKSMGCNFIDTRLDRRGVNPMKDLKLFINYLKILKRLKPDVVLTYTIKPNIYGGLVCRLLKTPYIETITGLGAVEEKTGFLRNCLLQLYKIALKKCNCVFFQNKYNMDYLINKNIITGKYKLIPGSGVNLLEHKFEEYPKDKKNVSFLFAGRIYSQKGVNELLQAIKIIKSKYDNICFDLVGFVELDYDDKLLKELQKQKMLVHHGKQDNVHEFIKNSHAVILPSYSEGMSNILLESAATGRPILASNIPGCQETFDEGITGFGFKPKSVTSLVLVLEKFINLPFEKKKEMGQLSRKKVEKEFDRQIVTNMYVEEIKKIIN